MINKNTLLVLSLLFLGTTFFSGCKSDDAEPDCEETKWFIDADGDGLGVEETFVMACEQPEGYVAESGDIVDVKVERKNVPIIFKITGETCYYCGAWGWDAWKNLADAFPNGAALSWANYGKGFSNGYFRNQELVSTMDPIENRFEDGGGKPNFAANGTDYSTSAANAQKAANDFISSTPSSISSVLVSSIEGNTLTVKAEAEVFADMTGTYVMGAYLIENNVMGPQAGPIGDAGDVAHHFVMRGSLSSDAWGEEIFTDASAGAKFNKTYTVDIPEAYNKDNFSYGIIIWKKVGSAHIFINAYSTQ